MPAPQFFLGRQPIVGRQRELVAYELLFRTSQENSASVEDDVVASAAVMQHAFSGLGLQSVLEDKLGFINLSAPLLCSDVIEILPRERVVLEILETVELTPAVIERCRALKAAGYRLALDDVIRFDEAQKAILPLVEVVKLDVLAMQARETEQLVRALKPYGVKLLAEKVDSTLQRDFCHELGCDLFQGYYFARPTILSGKPVQPSAMLLLKLLSQVAADADTQDLEDTLKHAPDLTVHLLRLVNSVAFGLPRKISSVRTALTLLGRAQLHRWVQIMVFAQQSSTHTAADPLVQTAAVRGHLMERLTQTLRPGDELLADRAFMVGMLSLIDALFGKPMEDVLKPLNLEDTVHEALLNRGGWIGYLLRLVEGIELADRNVTLTLLGGLENLSLDTLNRLQIEAMSWAARLGRDEEA
ncbi:cyclic diguanylate phosphodiesterase [Chitinimonas prasina]|uniref:Cyclic diguanylate phosphodiesterase n=1 Tax=Chitinimonas prasina TaxID=1434937 RepID=A0ABQ5YE92_9NEIS|nr:EAL domain-containing protein [Chitinimonas prasina]GLR11264.1 cyclic diguanylate phosphodiesterase [Chitinimonas prasina]